MSGIVGAEDWRAIVREAQAILSGEKGSDGKRLARTDGCLVQVTTQQRNPDGSHIVAEALAFVPGAKIGRDGLSLKDAETDF